MDRIMFTHAVNAAIQDIDISQVMSKPMVCPSCAMTGFENYLTLKRNQVVKLDTPVFPSDRLVSYNEDFVWDLQQLYGCGCCQALYYMHIPFTQFVYDWCEKGIEPRLAYESVCSKLPTTSED